MVKERRRAMAPSSDLPRKGTSPLDPILPCFFKRIHGDFVQACAEDTIVCSRLI
ncbi:hypothetical protein MBAV_005054 [Candidatus Magnetobacterium bavaricum]|uniref:Uncharacterized protein n=1 Tax=Candidatus Magnetobacterium bavaricum TaxID=29290 RepID=A0A0F3GLH8_9BACT|nr:hypothetical protein MBAV_005054 [Candidatus Magnetobacterium bavaricum]